MTTKLDTSSLRQEYLRGVLDEGDAPSDSMVLFDAWLQQAIDAGLPEPYAMTLATASRDGAPSARIVLLRGADARGFTFYTNYTSRKAEDLAANPQASLLFYWAALERQVRIEGLIATIESSESDAYFASRPYVNQIGAWASEQSRVIDSRERLDERFAEMRARFPDAVPRPPHWGGYRMFAASIEFWQGRASRLHDRLRYRRQADGGWLVERLYP